MGKVTDPGCIYCKKRSDDAEQTWQEEKNMLIEQIGEFTPDNIVDAMLEHTYMHTKLVITTHQSGLLT